MELVKNTKEYGKIQIDLSGKFTFDDHRMFDSEIIQTLLEQPTPKEIDIHLNEVEFIDSAGIGLLLLLEEKTKASSVKLTLHKPKDQVRKMLFLTHLNDIFNIIE